MNLEQIQKEQREALDNLFAPDGDTINAILAWRGVSDNGKCFKEDEEFQYLEPMRTFLSESIRIAYEAGIEASIPEDEVHTRSMLHGHDQGYRAGIERAKELVPNAYLYSPDEESQGHNQCRDEMLSNLDDELKKL